MGAELDQAYAELERLQRTIDSAGEAVRDAAARASAARRSAHERAAQSRRTLREQAEAVGAAHPEDFAAWDAESWRGWECDPHVPAELRVGVLESEPGIPATVPVFDGHTVVVATQSEQAAARARELLRSLAMRAAVAMGDRVVLHLLDPAQGGFGFAERRHLPQDAPQAATAAAALKTVIDAAAEFRSRHGGRAFADVDAGQPAHVVVALDFPRGYDYAAVEALNSVARLGPAGVQLIVHDRLEGDAGRGLALDRVVALSADAAGRLSGPWGSLGAVADAAPAEDLVRLLAPRMPAAAAESAVASLTWGSLNSAEPADWWQESAATGITATFGRTVDGRPLQLAFGLAEGGDAGSHAVVAGMTGSGKSILLHSVILSLATRYSPEQLRFYLLDGQSGVTMQTYATLPHAELVAVNTPVDLARGVLTDAAAELSRRDALLVSAGVDGIAEYWRREGPAAMPRLVIAIDEYQRLFEGDRRDETAAILQRVAAQGRKVGIHLLLLSQRFHATGLTNQAALFDNVGTRIALMLAEDAIPTVDEFGSRGRDLIRSHATAPGRVVVNAHRGSDTGNVLGEAAFVEPSDRERLVAELAAKAHSRALDIAPEVFQGTEQPCAAANRALRALATTDASTPRSVKAWAESPARAGGLAASGWQTFDRPLPFIAGRTFSVHGSAFAKLDRRSDHNVMIVADDPELLTGMVLTGVASAGLAVPRGGLAVDVLSELPPTGESWDGMLGRELAALLARRGHTIATAALGDVEALLGAAVQEVERRSQLPPEELAAQGTRLVTGVGLDRIPAFRAVDGKYGPEPSPAGAKLRRLLETGPDVGVHAVIGATSRPAWSRVLPGKEHRRFVHRFVQQMSEEDSRQLLDSYFAFGVMPPGVGGPARAGYTRGDDPTAYVFLPYSTAGQTLAALSGLYG